MSGMLAIVGVLLQYVYGSLESEMLRQTNKHRMEHNMEELYNLPSLQKAADLQVLHMCRNARLTHDGADERTMTLAGRLKEFGFVGLNIGENIAKQENDDYREVVRLWIKSPKHRNNILGDYVYSGVSTCVGRDNNRYWVQVFGKDMSNTKIARIRDGMDVQDVCEECERQQTKDKDVSSSRSSGGRGFDVSDGVSISRDKDKDAVDMGRRSFKRRDKSQGGDYIMLVKPEEGREELDGTQGLKRSDHRQGRVDGSAEDPQKLESMESRDARYREILGSGPGRNSHLDWRLIRRSKPVKGKSYVQRIADMNDEGAEKTDGGPDADVLGFGDYLLPFTPQGGVNPPGGRKVVDVPVTAVPRVSAPGPKVMVSTASIFTFVLRNPNNSSVLPAIQSLVDIIKQGSPGTPSLAGGSAVSQVTSSRTSSTTGEVTNPPTSADNKSTALMSPASQSAIPASVPSPKSEQTSTASVPSLVVTKVTTTTVYKEPDLSTLSVSVATPLRVSLETPKSVVTTTVYLPGHQQPAVIDTGKRLQNGPVKSRPLYNDREESQQEVRSAIMRLLGSDGGKPGRRVPGDGGTRPRTSERHSGPGGDEGMHGCTNGYNDDGSCVQKESDEGGLKDMLESLIRRGRLHLHISPAGWECSGDDECTNEGRRGIDIGIPFSHKS